MLNCPNESVVFLFNSTSVPVTSMHLYLRSFKMTGSQGYILFLASVPEKEQRLSKIPMVREYSYVFPKDILEFPPERDNEFPIELLPEAGPILVAPYQLLPSELVELKKKDEGMKLYVGYR